MLKTLVNKPKQALERTNNDGHLNRSQERPPVQMTHLTRARWVHSKIRKQKFASQAQTQERLESKHQNRKTPNVGETTPD